MYGTLCMTIFPTLNSYMHCNTRGTYRGMLAHVRKYLHRITVLITCAHFDILQDHIPQ